MKIAPWARSLVAAAALLLAVSWGVSGALQHGWARRPLLARLSAGFGRPVEVGSFAFSLLGGPRLEARSVTVAEDPRFGNEYFLRADQLSIALRWSALLRGRVEFGAVSLGNPSLNLVRAADGHWNVESWLPPLPAAHAQPAGAPGAVGTSAAAVAPAATVARRLGRIVIDGGRINFKLGDEKLLLALVDVSGNLDRDAAGRWNIDLQADPIRASVALQQAGTLRLRGTVAGTSARLRPARLDLTWDDASLADALRLARGQDYGARGALSAEIVAQVQAPSPDRSSGAGAPPDPPTNSASGPWTVAANARFTGIHRWDLPARDADPALHLSVGASWQPGAPDIKFDRCIVESAHSRISAVAAINWSRGFAPTLQIADSRLDLADALAWSRAFWPALPQAISVEGALSAKATLAGWPLRVQQAAVAMPGAALRWREASPPIRFGSLSATLRRDSLELAPVLVTLPAAPAPIRARGADDDASAPASAGALLVSGSLGPLSPAATGFVSGAGWPYRLSVSGHTTRAEDLLALAEAFGRRPSGDWKFAGGATLQLAWAGALRRAQPQQSTAAAAAALSAASPSGTIDLRDVAISTAVLNRPLLLSAATIELRPDGRRLRIAQAAAFGANWKGTLDWRAPERVWHFDLAADRLDAAELDRWLGPRARPSFFERMLPFALESPTSAAAAMAASAPSRDDAAIAHLAAYGRLRVAELALDPLRLERLDASVDLTGRNIALRRATAAFFGGRVSGEFEARLASEPSYSFRGQFDRVNLAALAEAAPALDGRLAGSAAGEILLSARGVGRRRLLDSLGGQGDLRVRDVVLRGFDFAPVAAPMAVPATALASASADSLRAVSDRIAFEKSAADSRFASAVASFHFSAGSVHVDDLSLTGRDTRLQLQGNVSSALALDLRVRPVARAVSSVASAGGEAAPEADPAPNAPQPDEWTIGGTLDAPLLSRPRRVAGDGAVARFPARP